MDIIDDETERIPHPRRRSDETTPAKLLGIAVVVVGLMGSVFGAGYNWRSVSIVESKQTQFEAEYVRRDVQSEQMQVLRFQITELTKAVEDLRYELRVRRGVKEQ